MHRSTGLLAATLMCAIHALPHMSMAHAIPPILMTPDKVETRIGPLQFKDGAPSADTAAKIYDTLDFTRGLDAFLNSYGGASAYAIRKGFISAGAEDNSIIIFPELMDAKSLFLTANADTVYYLGVVDLTKGPMVVEQPPKGLGTINDMWFGWIIDVGFPGRIAAKAGNTFSCRRIMMDRCPRAAFTSRSPGPHAFCTRLAPSSQITIPSRPSI